MDLRSHSPFSVMKNGIIRSYPSLHKTQKADVVIMGAGITGVLVAWHLCRAGMKVIIVDKRHAGMGSTAASTGLLQYEIDTPLHELEKKAGAKVAAESYLLCRQSIYDLEKICKGLPASTGFELKPSLQYASSKKDGKALEIEYTCRKKIGIELEYLTSSDVKHTFGFDAPAALFSKDGGQVGAYSLAHALLKDCDQYDLGVYDNTTVVDIRHYARHVVLTTEFGNSISAKKLVIACGYESQKYLSKKVEALHSTYAIVTEPFINGNFWHKDSLLWETAEDYLYVRTTSDKRLLIGGKDDPFYDPVRRDENLKSKAALLVKSFARLFPQYECRIDFQWAGTFGKTKDGLPYIGAVPERPHTWFALGYGGNGITFSVLAAQYIRDAMQGKKNKIASLFAFNR